MLATITLLSLFILRGESINVGSLFVVIFLNFMRFIITERQKIYASNSLSVVTVHSEGVNLLKLVLCLSLLS